MAYDDLHGWRPSCRLQALALLGILLSAGGAGCPQFLQRPLPVAVRVLPERPTLPDVIQAVNENSNRIQSLYTTEARIQMAGLPPMQADLALNRPRDFRLRARVLGSMPTADLGSNQDFFWSWSRMNNPPGVYYCRHDEFYGSSASSFLPVEPQWMIEALGIVVLDPAAPHRGPIPSGLGRLRIETPIATTRGPGTKVTVVDEARGWVLEQHLYASDGSLLASAKTSKHAKEPGSGVTLPAHIEIEWPEQRLSFEMDLRQLHVNRLPENSAALWNLPAYAGHPPLNLAQ